MNPPTHLMPTESNRGFLWMPPLPDTYDTDTVRIFESSAASEACIWLRVGTDDEQATAHLDLATARKLAEQIDYLIRNHRMARQDTP